MKTRDEYLESIFEKRNQYAAEQRKKRKTVLSLCVPLTVCIAAGTVVIFGSSHADNQAKSLDQDVGTSLNGAMMLDECYPADESGRYAVGGEDDICVDDSGKVVNKESTAAAVQENSPETSEDNKATGTTTAASNETTKNTSTKDSDELDGMLQMTAAGYTNTTSDHSTTTAVAATTKRETAMALYIKSVSVSISSGTGWAYSSEKDYSGYDSAFIWAVEGGLDKLDAAARPAGEIYTINLILSDGTTKTFKWSGNSLCDERGAWKTISDSKKSAIAAAVSNEE